MKKLILTIILLFSTSAFSINGVAQWEKDMKTHGKALTSQEWTKKVTEPKNCRYGDMEMKLYEIGTLSVGFMGSHPDNWLNGKYLEYVNSRCTLNLPLRITKEDFNESVDRFFKVKEGSYKKNAINDFFLNLILLMLPIILFLIVALFSKGMILSIKRMWFS